MLYFDNYISLFIYFIVSCALGFVILGASYFLAYQNPDVEKLAAYECGFDPYEDSRNNFEIKFFLISLLFLLFDIEAIFLFPWAVSLTFLKSLGFWVVFDFLFELLLGFCYAWILGAFIWE